MAQEVTVEILTEVFGITKRRVQELAKEGIVKKASHGKYLLWESVKNYILFLKKSDTANVGSDAASGVDESAPEMKRRKLVLECARLDVRLQAEKGKLIDIATAAEATQTIASVLCSEGQAMISDLRGQLAGLDEITIGERMTARWTQLLQATVRRLQEPIV